jgi:cyclophilin family peptidyl-prolyl cis-trans isomerase
MKILLMFAAAAASTPVPKPAPAPSEIVAAAPAGDWVAIAPSDLLVMDLAGGKRVVIQLMPPPFSQGWVGNIRKLAAAHWWDGTSINRVQDNYVVQWGNANAEDKAKAKGSPIDLARVPETAYRQQLPPALEARWVSVMEQFSEQMRMNMAQVSAEDRALPAPSIMRDSYAVGSDFWLGWPIAAEGKQIWPVHCYGMVGVGRGMPPDTGTGAELYTVIGHAPRHLDRNIALVGRVISGIENLSSLPRGTGDLGFYKTPAERTGIASIRIGTEVAGLPRFEYLSTESASFAKYADARANRRDAFFIQPAGGADICNIPVPVRAVK